MANPKWIFLCVVLVILFNVSYFANSGLLIAGLNRATPINYRNAHLHADFRSMDDPLVLSRFSMEEFMTPEQAHSMALRVRADKSRWETRNGAMSTLGTASYLDGAQSKEYERLAIRSNPYMRTRYGDLLDMVLQYFQDRCPSANVQYRDKAALPGFHIFHCNRLFAMPVASVHKDMQWNRLRYAEDEDIDTNHTLSFTLSLELPPGGGGLYTFEGFQPPGLLSYVIPRPLTNGLAKKTFIEYKVGWMVTHNGQTYHMIAPCKQTEDGYRITLQGHGVYERNANTWWLYW